MTWAQIMPMRPFERLAADQVLASCDTTIKVRWAPIIKSIDATWRVLYGSKIYNIVGPLNDDERCREVIMMCRTGTNRG